MMGWLIYRTIRFLRNAVSVFLFLFMSGSDHEDVAIGDCEDDIVPGGSKDRKCPWCPQIFSSGQSLKKHLGDYHATHSPFSDSRKKEGSGSLLCAQRECGAMLTSYDALCRHCEDQHGFERDNLNLRFDSDEEFKGWLEHLFSISGRMVRRRGERRTADGIVMGDYHCVFDGKKRETPSSRGSGRSPYNRRVPSKKLGFACPAYIRFQIQMDGSVIIKAQLQHFGHTIQPREVGSSLSKINRPSARMLGRRKRRGYAFDGLHYDEMDSQHMAHQFVEGDEMEVDEHGMVNLFNVPPLERARFLAQSSCASLDLAFTEVQSIPHENVQHLGFLIEKLNEITAAAGEIEGYLKNLTTLPELTDHSRIEDLSAKRKMIKAGPQLNRKRLLPVSGKREANERNKRSILESNGANEEESFEQQCDSGELVYHSDVAGEVIVDDVDEFAEEKPEIIEKKEEKL